VKESPTRHERSLPQDGDVVVAREAHSSVHYTVRQLPGIVQFSSAVRDEALQLARGFSQRYAVDVWYGEAGTYQLLESYRPPTLAHAGTGSIARSEAATKTPKVRTRR
jgi:hypothetical protein